MVMIKDVVDAIKDWFNFKTLMTPMLIKVIYILANVGFFIIFVIGTLNWLGSIWQWLNSSSNQDNNWYSFLISNAIMVLNIVFFLSGLFITRLLCELAIVGFGIHDTLVKIEKRK